jgi:hypothetical protein
MLNTAYKVLSRIIYTRIEPEVDRVLGEYQAGFRKNRSTADHQFSLQQIIEKSLWFFKSVTTTDFKMRKTTFSI